MSTVMYCYKVSKDQWWEVFDLIKNYYFENHRGFKIVRNLSDKITKEDLLFHQAYNTLEDLDLSCEIQIFEIENEYYFRVLEDGYFFMNNRSKIAPGKFLDCFYDDRTDILPEEEKNLSISEKIDALIKNRHYFVSYVLKVRELQNYLTELELGKKVKPI